MNLRRLNQSDASKMLEWMHDKEVVGNLKADFASKTINDCEKFIVNTALDRNNLHMAITDESGIYMGTVSIKNIDRNNKTGEFAITVRKSAMGKGYAQYAIKEIIRIGFQELNLNYIYWCVSRKNLRAIKFYDKMGYKEIEMISREILQRYQGEDDLKWYGVEKI